MTRPLSAMHFGPISGEHYDGTSNAIAAVLQQGRVTPGQLPPAVPGALLDDGYPDDWYVPPSAQGDGFPDDWYVPASAMGPSVAQPASAPQSGAANWGSSSAPPDLLASLFGTMPASGLSPVPAGLPPTRVLGLDPPPPPLPFGAPAAPAGRLFGRCYQPMPPTPFGAPALPAAGVMGSAGGPLYSASNVLGPHPGPPPTPFGTARLAGGLSGGGWGPMYGRLTLPPPGSLFPPLLGGVVGPTWSSPEPESEDDDEED